MSNERKPGPIRYNELDRQYPGEAYVAKPHEPNSVHAIKTVYLGAGDASDPALIRYIEVRASDYPRPSDVFGLPSLFKPAVEERRLQYTVKLVSVSYSEDPTFEDPEKKLPNYSERHQLLVKPFFTGTAKGALDKGHEIYTQQVIKEHNQRENIEEATASPNLGIESISEDEIKTIVPEEVQTAPPILNQEIPLVDLDKDIDWDDGADGPEHTL